MFFFLKIKILKKYYNQKIKTTYKLAIFYFCLKKINMSHSKK